MLETHEIYPGPLPLPRRRGEKQNRGYRLSQFELFRATWGSGMDDAGKAKPHLTLVHNNPGKTGTAEDE